MQILPLVIIAWFLQKYTCFTLRHSCLVSESRLYSISSVLLAFWSPCLGERELVFVLIMHLFVSFAHVNLCHFFSSSWCQELAATSACGSSWTLLFTFLCSLCFSWVFTEIWHHFLILEVVVVGHENISRGVVCCWRRDVHLVLLVAWETCPGSVWWGWLISWTCPWLLLGRKITNETDKKKQFVYF